MSSLWAKIPSLQKDFVIDMKRGTDKRLTDIEKSMQKCNKYAPIIAAIRKHTYYDELPKDEYKTLYCQYIGVSRKAFEEVSIMISGDLHTMLQEPETSITPEEMEKRIEEVEEIIKNMIEEEEKGN